MEVLDNQLVANIPGGFSSKDSMANVPGTCTIDIRVTRVIRITLCLAFYFCFLKSLVLFSNVRKLDCFNHSLEPCVFVIGIGRH